ncbi:hypothetical protein FBF28_03550 [Candidatus Saccharibacteria bacterium oral taxon 488]|nr:hypothetical protein FBF28_03550 [Candidatus Saccharibacteria bacterium oral taxon 488]
MEEIITKIDSLAKQMNERFETVDKRLDKMDGHLGKMGERFDAVETRLGNLEQGQAAIRKDIKNSDDIFQLFELKTDHNFKKVMAIQSDLKAELASLRTRLFLEEGSREHADTVGWDTQDKKWRALDKRLHAVEAHLGLG